MRSPNKRSRSKSNRPKTLGNIVNRVFDSSGPEGKVRGTPQQIIEKYQVLARDAQLSNDRVAAENFQQHAEHYTRMLAQAQREQQAEQEARRQQHEDRNRAQAEERAQDRSERNGGQNGQQNHRRNDQRRHGEGAQDPRDQGGSDAFSVQDTGSGNADQGSLVETPEAGASSAEAARPEQDAPAPAAEAQPVPAGAEADAEAKPAKPRRQPRARKADTPAEDGQPAKPRRNTRKPRKTAQDEASDTSPPPSEAAE